MYKLHLTFLLLTMKNNLYSSVESSTSSVALLSSSSSFITLVTAAIESLPLMLMSFTPWVARPQMRKVSIERRMAIPDLLIIIKSSPSATLLIATNCPVLSVIEMVFTPLPPRLVILYTAS